MNIISKSRLILAFSLLSVIGVAESSSYSDKGTEQEISKWDTGNEKNRGLLLNEADIRSATINDASSGEENKSVSRTRNIPIPAAILLFGPAVLCLMGLSGKRK